MVPWQFVGNKARGRISARVFQENKARQIFRKTNIFYSLIRTRTCAYQGVKNVRFWENLACFVFLEHPFWDSPFCLITDSFCCSPNNYENVSRKITEFDKEKARCKEHNSSKSAKSSEWSNDLSVLDHVRLNNSDRLIIGHRNINFLRIKFEMLREIVQVKSDFCRSQKQK